jgi:hypothetical protein
MATEITSRMKTKTKTKIIIQDTKLYKLFKTGNYIYDLQIKGNNKPVYLSLLKTKQLTNIFYNPDENTICFTAEKVETLETYLDSQPGLLSEALCIKMIDSLTQQIKCLEAHKYAYYGHNIEDILVIDNNIFININPNTLLPIQEGNIITFISPFEKPEFVSPLIKQITFLPTKVPFQEGYYSLATLVIYCILNVIIDPEINQEINNIDSILKPIFYTKTYWFLKRCLNQNILLLI